MTDGAGSQVSPGADDMPLPSNPGLVDRLIGAVIRRVVRVSEADLKDAFASLGPSRPPDQEPAGRRLDLYVPEPGQEPAPAEVITDPDLAARLPRLLERQWPYAPPEILRRVRRQRAFRFWPALLEEDGDAVVVRVDNERIGKLKPADAEVYAAHLRSARLNDQFVAVVVRGSIAGRRSLRVTVSIKN